MISTIVYFLVFIFGSSFGSFLNVVIDRLPNNLPLLISRSRCESCKKTLKWYDLFPVFSYLFLFGKCRYCKSIIPARIFFVELITGTIFAYLFFLFFSGIINVVLFFLFSVIAFCLIVIFFTDLKFGIIPDEILLVLLFSGLAVNLLFNWENFMSFVLSGIGALLFFLLLFLLTRGKGMGFGDVKFSFFVGFLLGFPKSLLAFYLAFLTGAFISVILIAWGKKRFKKDTVPFGPFLIAGICLTILYSDKIFRFL